MEVKILGKSDISEVVDLGLKIFSPIVGKKESQKTHCRRKYLEKLDSNGFFFGAYINNKIVGYVLGYEKQKGVFHLSLLGVLPLYRKKGIGKKLLKEAEAKAKDLGYKKLAINTFVPIFIPMYNLLVKSGFNIVKKSQVKFGDQKIQAVEYILIKNIK